MIYVSFVLCWLLPFSVNYLSNRRKLLSYKCLCIRYLYHKKFDTLMSFDPDPKINCSHMLSWTAYGHVISYFHKLSETISQVLNLEDAVE
jgi:hypothetical protein